MSTHTFDVDFCLFDLDGTLVSTTVAAEKTWTDLCNLHGVDPQELFKYSHGSRTVEMLAKFFPKLDNTDNKAVVELETTMATKYCDSVSLIPGSKDLLLSLDGEVPKSDKSKPFGKRKWAIVTSGSTAIAFTWFKTILKDVGKPDVFITAFDVKNGKPDPEGYAKARDDLAKIWKYNDLLNCKTVVFEDAPVGIKAGKAIGAITIGITSTFSKEVLFEAGADYVVEDLTHVSVIKNSAHGNITLQVTNPLSK